MVQEACFLERFKDGEIVHRIAARDQPNASMDGRSSIAG
jgi:hypothetical protein